MGWGVVGKKLIPQESNLRLGLRWLQVSLKAKRLQRMEKRHIEVGESNNPKHPQNVWYVGGITNEREATEQIQYLYASGVSRKERTACVFRSKRVLTGLTCCAEHTSHSGDLRIQDIRCRLCTDHTPPLGSSTAAMRYKYH